MRKKQGFSLAEVLIALIIAAIIATLGFTIAKKGIDKTYDMYIFAGYQAIWESLIDAEIQAVNKIESCGNFGSSCDVTNRLYRTLSGRNPKNSSGGFEFDTPNGIHYKLAKYGTRDGIDNIGEEKKGTYYITDYRITMTVPAPNNTEKYVCMSYQKNSIYNNYLIPYECEGAPPKGPNDEDDPKYPRVYMRKNLLPFYIEDGNRGTLDSNGNYQPRYFRSAEEVFCLIFGKGKDGIYDDNLYGATNSVIINCANVRNKITASPTYYKNFEQGNSDNVIIRVTDPRRL